MSDALDTPLFDPGAYHLTYGQAHLIARARRLGAERFAPRAAQHDRDASFPTENYHDLRDAGLLAVCIPERDGGLGADYLSYVLAAAEVARSCGATALTWNMHVCSTLWTGSLADDLEMTAEERKTDRKSTRLNSSHRT